MMAPLLCIGLQLVSREYWHDSRLPKDQALLKIAVVQLITLRFSIIRESYEAHWLWPKVQLFEALHSAVLVVGTVIDSFQDLQRMVREKDIAELCMSRGPCQMKQHCTVRTWCMPNIGTCRHWLKSLPKD